MNSLYPAIIGLIGVIVGGLISFITSYFSKRKETQLRIIEKIFEKRIQSHEDILKISQRLRTTISLNKTDSNGNALTYPSILHSPKVFENFKGVFYELTNSNVHWISIELFRELNYIQDYIETLTINLRNVHSNNYPKVALLIKSDIIDLAADIEKETRKFFSNDIYSIKINATTGHHKYPKHLTISRIESSLLWKNFNLIEEMKE